MPFSPPSAWCHSNHVPGHTIGVVETGHTSVTVKENVHTMFAILSDKQDLAQNSREILYMKKLHVGRLLPY